MTGLFDSFQRPIDYLRISVTDRCNLRCIYCMPPQGITLCSHGDILSYEELASVVRAAAAQGISKVRITGGEPLVRRGITGFVSQVKRIPGIDDIAMTTNGVFLADNAGALKEAGLDRVNISLDTLKPERFREITGNRADISDVLRGIQAATRAGLTPVKINTVVMGGVNDDELLDFARRTVTDGWNVRFIERMPFYGEEYTAGDYVSAREMRERLWALGKLERSEPRAGNGPARYYRLPGAKGTIGFITPVSEHFCQSCNRLRLTADGKLRPCLLSEDEIDLRAALRNGHSPAHLEELIAEGVARKPRRHHLDDESGGKHRPFSQVGG